jgi:hypothetical protein
MSARFLLACVFSLLLPALGRACCAVGRFDQPAINGSQNVLLIWDAATKTEHFIRQASFLAAGPDFGFIVPTPSRPELSESGDEAFPMLADITKPIPKWGGITFGTPRGMTSAAIDATGIAVIERKEVAGYDAAVLAASSATALTEWLKTNGYAFSPEVQSWAAPYIRDGWMLTALRVAKKKEAEPPTSATATALRISFHTERPLFPYREPKNSSAAQSLRTGPRVLRLYFVSDARYKGTFDGETLPFNQTNWSQALTDAQKSNLLGALKLPPDAGPSTWWLTEFDHYWPYQTDFGDLYFSRDSDQSSVLRFRTSQPWDIMYPVFLLVGGGAIATIWWTIRRGRNIGLAPS